MAVVPTEPMVLDFKFMRFVELEDDVTLFGRLYGLNTKFEIIKKFIISKS